MKITLASNYQTVEWEVESVSTIDTNELKRVIDLVNYLGQQIDPSPTKPEKSGSRPASESQINYVKGLYGKDYNTEGLSYEEANRLIRAKKK